MSELLEAKFRSRKFRGTTERVRQRKVVLHAIVRGTTERVCQRMVVLHAIVRVYVPVPNECVKER